MNKIKKTKTKQEQKINLVPLSLQYFFNYNIKLCQKNCKELNDDDDDDDDDSYKYKMILTIVMLLQIIIMIITYLKNLHVFVGTRNYFDN